MNRIEMELLRKMIFDREFAEYITQRIDLNDFDDLVANQIYTYLIELLFKRIAIAEEDLFDHFLGQQEVIRSLSLIMNPKDK